MTIHPFIAGILATLFVEMVLIIVSSFIHKGE